MRTKIAGLLKPTGLALLVTGATLFETTSCSISDTLSSLLTTYGLSQFLESLFGTGSTA